MSIQLKHYNPDTKYYAIVEVLTNTKKEHWTFSLSPEGINRDYFVFEFKQLPTEKDIMNKLETEPVFKTKLNATERLETVKVAGYTIITPLIRKEIVYR